MEVIEIVKDVANLLQLSNVLSFDFENGNLATAADLTKRDINLIVKCLNHVLSTVATEYVEFLSKETISVSNGYYQLSNLSKNYYKIKKVSDKKFKVIDGNLYVEENGNFEIIYSYIPEEVELDDEFDFCENLSKYAICYGICSQYCLILGDFAQSETWESKFENALEGAKSNLKIAKPKPRRWI